MNHSLASLVVAAFAFGACSPSHPPPPAETAETTAPDMEPTAAVPPSPGTSDCVLTQAGMTIEHLRLTSADGACTVLLPTPVSIQEYPVAASASQSAASVELRRADGTLYATAGSVNVTAIGERIVGTISADDQSPPSTGEIAGTFDIATP